MEEGSLIAQVEHLSNTVETLKSRLSSTQALLQMYKNKAETYVVPDIEKALANSAHFVRPRISKVLWAPYRTTFTTKVLIGEIMYTFTYLYLNSKDNAVTALLISAGGFKSTFLNRVVVVDRDTVFSYHNTFDVKVFNFFKKIFTLGLL